MNTLNIGKTNTNSLKTLVLMEKYSLYIWEINK